MNPRSLRFRLIAWFSGLLMIVLIAFGAYTYARLESFLIEVQDAILQHRAEQISEMLRQRNSGGEATVGERIESRFAPELNDKFVRVTRPDGRDLFLSGPPNDHSFDPSSLPRPSALKQGATMRRERGFDHEVLIATLEMPVSDGGYVVEVGASLTNSSRVLHTLLLTLAVGLPFVMALAIFGGYVLIRRALDPVESITQAAQDITFHHLDRRLPVPNSGDEIARLSSVLNQMIARLDEAFQNTSRFTADASHELRTPLTILRGELETVLRQRDLQPSARTVLASSLEEIERLVKIVERLFALSRLDAGEAQAERVRFDLSQLTSTTIEQMCLLAEEKQISLTAETESSVEVEGDRARLKQVIVNLLDNAVKYTPSGGHISVAVRGENGTAILEVRDDGPGVPESAIPHLFERFFRADDSRSREVDGAGLGLSIVHSICAAHGGSIAAQNTAPTGFQVTVALPRTR